MNTQFNGIIVEENGIRSISGGGTNASTATAALANLGGYPASNPSGYLTGIDTSNFYTKNNPSGYITGIENLVYITRDQSISGVKTFTNGISSDSITSIQSGYSIGLNENLDGLLGIQYSGYFDSDPTWFSTASIKPIVNQIILSNSSENEFNDTFTRVASVENQGQYYFTGLNGGTISYYQTYPNLIESYWYLDSPSTSKFKSYDLETWEQNPQGTYGSVPPTATITQTQNSENSTNFGINRPLSNGTSWEWNGLFRPQNTSNHNFNMYADEDAYFWIGDKALNGYTTGNADMYSSAYAQSTIVDLALTSGVCYPVRLQWGHPENPTNLGLNLSYNDGVSSSNNFSGLFFHGLSRGGFNIDGVSGNAYFAGNLQSNSATIDIVDGITGRFDYIEASNLVYTTGNQTISGTKIFVDSISVEDGTSNVYTLFVSGQNVGINNENPTSALDVSGLTKFSERPFVNGTGVLLSGEFDGSLFYPRSNPSGYISGDLSLLYPRSNPSGFISGVSQFDYISGDLTGNLLSPSLHSIQGNPVSALTPSGGQILQWNGYAWVPGSVPNGGNGGGGITYYLNYLNKSGIAPTGGLPINGLSPSQLGRNYSVGSGFVQSTNLDQGTYGLICGFITPSGDPGVDNVPAGLWDFNIWADVVGNNGQANQTQFQVRTYKYNAASGTYASLANSDDVYIYDPNTTAQYIANVTMPQTEILSTERIYVEIWAKKNVSQNRQIRFYFDSLHPSHCHTTLPAVAGNGIVKVINGVMQSPASTIVNADVSPTAAIEVSKLLGVVAKAGDTMTGKLIVAANTTISKLNIGNALVGAANPTTTVDGDVWVNNGNRLAYKANSSVYTIPVVNSPNAFSSTQIIDVTSANTALRVTQKGEGESLRIENEANPDSTPFVVSNSGRVGIGVVPDATVGLKVDSTGIKFNNGSVQTIAAVSASVGAVDNSVLRADVGTGIVQNSDIIIDDSTTSTQNNVALVNNHQGQTDSSVVITPKGSGAFILGPKPDGTAVGGNARGSSAVDLQVSRTDALQVASGNFSVVAGGSINSASGANSVVVGGAGNSSTASSSFVGAGSSNSASGLNSVVVGGTTNSAASTGTFIGGGRVNSISGGINSVVVGGNANSISVSNSFIGGGLGNTVSATRSSIIGGVQALADRYGMRAYSAGFFSANGDAQDARFILRAKTINTTPVEMTLDGFGTYLVIPSGKVIAMTMNMSGVKSDGTAVAHYVRQYAVKNVAGTSSQVYAPVTIGSDNPSGTSIALSVNDSDDTLRILVIGIASETWRWVATVDAVEIGYGA